MTEHPLITFLRDRSPEHFGALVESAGAEILAFLRRLLGDEALAEEATQEVFCRVFEARWEFEHISEPGAFLRAVAAGEGITLLRAECRHRDRPRRLADQKRKRSISDNDDARDEALDVRAAVEELPAFLADIVLLRYFGGMEPCEARALLDLPRTTFHRREQKALTLLRKRLSPALLATLIPVLEGHAAVSIPAAASAVDFGSVNSGASLDGSPPDPPRPEFLRQVADLARGGPGRSFPLRAEPWLSGDTRKILIGAGIGALLLAAFFGYLLLRASGNSPFHREVETMQLDLEDPIERSEPHRDRVAGRDGFLQIPG